ncbi:SMI1/KNR4 family protein [Actinacidiphila sp. bgisy145]|uniref:SMI1/KNR4 family protein n=1 Tax=Actinacidiphila sp. bgisy145 TaxID=3413792 RepID=UPI003EBBA2AC
MGFMAELVEPLVREGLAAREEVLGCSEEEVAVLMEAQGVTRIPDAYREFLRYGGRYPYWLTHTGEWHYDWLLDIKDTAREIVADEGQGEWRDFTPYERAYVFQTHQGYEFFCFRPEDLAAPDPHFLVYNGRDGTHDSGTTFTGWLRDLAAHLPQAVALRRKVGLPG